MNIFHLPRFYLLCWCALLLFACENPSEQAKPAPTPPATCTRKTGTASLPNQSAGEKIDPTKEPCYQDQWYLKNTTGGIDINVEPVWQKGYGTKSVNVGILDETIDKTYPDPKNNILNIRAFRPYDTQLSHGTNVAGIIAARDNGQGILGVAPRAKIYGYGLFQDPTKITISERASNIAEALNFPEHTTIAVYNGSFQKGSADTYQKLSRQVKEAMDKVTEYGFYGKGSNIVFSVGNFGLGPVTSNKAYLRHHAVIGVNTLKGKSNPVFLLPFSAITGVNIWITAPTVEVLTTKNEGEYEEKFSGTSAAAPMVSGAIALLRSDFPKLTWRDVKLILAESAVKNDYQNLASYQKSGIKYSDGSEQQYSHLMGFGLLDVEAAFTMAEKWTPLPPMQESTHKQETPLSSIEKRKKATSTLNVTDSDIDFIESVTLTMEIKKTTASELFLGAWFLRLISPEGIQGAMYDDPDNSMEDRTKIFDNTLTFVVNAFLGSKADGTWKLEIQQNEEQQLFKDEGIINEITDWSLTFRGH